MSQGRKAREMKAPTTTIPDWSAGYTLKTKKEIIDWANKYEKREGVDFPNIVEGYINAEVKNSLRVPVPSPTEKFDGLIDAIDLEEYKAYCKHLLSEDETSIDEYIHLFENELIDEVLKLMNDPIEFAKFFPITTAMIAEIEKITIEYYEKPAIIASNILYNNIGFYYNDLNEKNNGN